MAGIGGGGGASAGGQKKKKRKRRKTKSVNLFIFSGEGPRICAKWELSCG